MCTYLDFAEVRQCLQELLSELEHKSRVLNRAVGLYGVGDVFVCSTVFFATRHAALRSTMLVPEVVLGLWLIELLV